jgi:hypothetical protein
MTRELDIRRDAKSMAAWKGRGVVVRGPFSKALAEKNIPHVFEMYEGGDHGSKIRQRFETHVLPFFSEKLER